LRVSAALAFRRSAAIPPARPAACLATHSWQCSPGTAQVKSPFADQREDYRRLIIALGFLTRHPILLMDEPFDGFDLRQSRDMMDTLRRVAAGGRTLVLSIHQLRDAEQVCDRFALLADGRIRGVGTLDALRSRANRPGGTLEDIFLALT
jgi:ABC-type Na+ transport system ATPase subunit NatA